MRDSLDDNDSRQTLSPINFHRFVIYPRDLVLVILSAIVTLLLALGPIWPRSTDVIVYSKYGLQFLVAHQFPSEYPPLAVIAFLIPHAFPGDPYLAFGGAMVGVVLVTYLLALQRTSRFSALGMALYTLFGVIPMIVGRYDVLPALLTLFALYATRLRQWRVAYLLLAIGIFVKLYPLVLIPVIFIAQWQSLQILPTVARLRKIGVTLLPGLSASLIILMVSFFISPTTALHFLTFISQRPVQIESVSGSLIWVWDMIRGMPFTIGAEYGSHNFAGTTSRILAEGSPYLMILGVGWAYVRQYLGHLSIERAFICVIGITLMTSKVFSTQYLIWLLPFLSEGEGLSLLWIGICGLTSLDAYWYPFIAPHQSTLASIQRFLGVVALRNLLLSIAILRRLTNPFSFHEAK